jgi:hypothetical protein
VIGVLTFPKSGTFVKLEMSFPATAKLCPAAGGIASQRPDGVRRPSPAGL